MEYRRLAENEVGFLDVDINSYVEQVIPMLLPLDATKVEKEKLRKILFQVTALNVYDMKIDALFDKLNRMQRNPYVRVSTTELRNYSEPEISALWCELERTKPHMAYRHQLLKRSQNSRYTALKIWKDNNPELSAYSSRRLVKEYTKRMWTKSTYKSAKDYEETPIQVQTIFSLRDFFHYGGDLEEVNLNSEEFKKVESIVSKMREDLIHKMENLRFYENNKYLRNPRTFSSVAKASKDKAFFDACVSTTNFSRKNKFLAYKISAEKSAMAKQEKLLTAKEYKELSKQVLDMFDKNFSALPTNEAEHKAQLDRLFREMAEMLAKEPEMKRTKTEEYIKLMKDTYRKYMDQLRKEKLPVRLSYFPEDKEMYAQIVSEARKEQEREKKYGKESDFNVGTAIIGLAGAVVISSFTLDALRDNNALPLIIESGTAVSAYIVKKVAEHRRLFMDVRKRRSIRNMTISEAKATLKDEKEDADEVLTGEQKADGIKFKYQEVSAGKNIDNQSYNPTNQQSTYVRRRRSERYNTNDANEH